MLPGNSKSADPKSSKQLPYSWTLTRCDCEAHYVNEITLHTPQNPTYIFLRQLTKNVLKGSGDYLYKSKIKDTVTV